jgi:hypothetical protein
MDHIKELHDRNYHSRRTERSHAVPDGTLPGERERYLLHLMQRGFGPAYLRTVSFFLLRIVEFRRLTTLRTVEVEEIERATFAWAVYRGPGPRGVKVTGNTSVRFPRVAKN